MTATLTIKPKQECLWDLVSLGEVMLRLDPGDERISTTRHFRAWEGGGEYNVARGLRRCFGLDTAIVTALADNPIGRLVEDLMLQGGVSQKYVRWAPYDGVGRSVRNGLNFTERGFGVRAARRLLRSRAHRRLATQARRNRLGPDFRERWRALVSHRWHFLRALGNHACRGRRSHAGGQARAAPSSPTI